MSTDLDLVITRDIGTPRNKLYRRWTEPALIKRCTSQLAELAATL